MKGWRDDEEGKAPERNPFKRKGERCLKIPHRQRGRMLRGRKKSGAETRMPFKYSWELAFTIDRREIAKAEE